MEFLKNNLRGIIISLLVAGAIIGIASISNDDTDDTNEAETSQSEENNQDGEKANDEGEENNDSKPKDDDASMENDGDSDEGNENQPEVSSNDDGFTSTTASGDNQTVVVRRIVSNYLNTSDTELSAEQMLYVETNLVNDVGRNDLVAVGENISLSNATVEQRVEEAKNLSDAAIERWSAYL